MLDSIFVSICCLDTMRPATRVSALLFAIRRCRLYDTSCGVCGHAGGSVQKSSSNAGPPSPPVLPSFLFVILLSSPSPCPFVAQQPLLRSVLQNGKSVASFSHLVAFFLLTNRSGWPCQTEPSSTVATARHTEGGTGQAAAPAAPALAREAARGACSSAIPTPGTTRAWCWPAMAVETGECVDLARGGAVGSSVLPLSPVVTSFVVEDVLVLFRRIFSGGAGGGGPRGVVVKSKVYLVSCVEVWFHLPSVFRCGFLQVCMYSV